MSAPDDLIDLLAQLYHQAYLGALSEAERLTNPSNVGWESLPPDKRQQGYRQVRHIVEFIESSGLQIELAGGDLSGPVVEQLDEVDLHRFGRIEHDGWAQYKIAQGYVWGPRRDETTSPKLHPDLKDYDDLDLETQAKDYGPLEQIVEILESVDRVLVRPQ